jgi:hypothetical protein
MSGGLYCASCEERKLRQLAIHKKWKEGKAYAQSKGLNKFVLCLLIDTNGYEYCEVGDPRIGVTLKELETIII